MWRRWPKMTYVFALKLRFRTKNDNDMLTKGRLDAEKVGYPKNHSNHTGPPDKELWWQRYNPVLHEEYRTMTVDGNPLDGEH